MTDGVGYQLRPVPHYISTVEELRTEVARHAQFDSFALDVETDGLHTVTNSVLWIGIASPAGVSIIPIGHPNGYLKVPAHKYDEPIPGTARPYKNNPNKFTKPKTRAVQVPAEFYPPPPQLRPDVAFAELRPLLRPDVPRTVIGQNIKFDMMSIAKYYDEDTDKLTYADTIIITHLLNENLIEYGFKSLVCKWLLGPNHDIKKRKAFYPDLGAKIMTSSFDDVLRYLAMDVYYCWLYWNRYRQKLPKDLEPALAIEQAVYPVLMDMQRTGILVDEDGLRAAQKEISEQLEQIELDAWAEAGVQFSLTNTHQKRGLLFDPPSVGGQGLQPLSYSKKTNTPQVDRKVLEFYAPTNALADALLRHSVVDKRRQFVNGLLDPDNLVDGRIHTSFNQHRTETGRLSSSGPNLQNVPKESEMRSAFVAPRGSRLIVADYDQIELRCIAMLSGDPEMIRLFKEGEDIHREAAASMLTVPPEDITDEQRQMGKTVNFSVGYGATSQRVAAVTGVSVEQAQVFIDRYYQRFSWLLPWKQDILLSAIARGSREDPLHHPPYVIIPPFGRRRRVLELFDSERKVRESGQRQAINAVVQGFASYIMKMAMIDLHQELQHGRMELQVHDEVVIEVDANYQHSELATVIRVMEGVQFEGQPVLGEVPLIASAHIGASWKEGKGK